MSFIHIFNLVEIFGLPYFTQIVTETLSGIHVSIFIYIRTSIKTSGITTLTPKAVTSGDLKKLMVKLTTINAFKSQQNETAMIVYDST